MIVIQSFADPATIHTRSAEVVTSIDAARRPNERVLSVAYPAKTDDPAARDVWCDAEHTDWSAGRAIEFEILADPPLRVSVSFLDRNRVAYTSWVDVAGDAWQTARIAFDTIRPNPYFQPPGANTAEALDVSDVARIGFAPQAPGPGRFAIGRIAVTD